MLLSNGKKNNNQNAGLKDTDSTVKVEVGMIHSIFTLVCAGEQHQYTVAAYRYCISGVST